MSDARRHLLRIQRDIYSSLATEAKALLGRQPAAIEEYETQFARDFRSVTVRPVTKRALLDEIRASDVTLIGDYHTFAQAQRTALRLLREAARPGENWALGIELVASDQQAALDAFQAGRMSVDEFHERIGYDEEWGFPWRNYAPLFEWCAANGVRMIALNRPKRLYGGGLAARDLWAAGLLADAFAEARAEGEPLRVIALYGELHLGSQHLPRTLEKTCRKYLKRPVRVTVVHQNHDEIYWKVAARGPVSPIVRLKPRVYCAFSSPPWTKLQSLVNWLQGAPADLSVSTATEDDPDYETEGETDDGVDYLSLMKSSLKPIADFLGVVPPPLDMITAHTIRDADFIDALEKDLRFSPAEFRVLKRHVLENARVYLPRSNVVYLGIPSGNAAAELAAVHLFRRRHGSVEILRTDAEGVARLVLEHAFGFLGSLVLNPRRKCDLPADHRRRIAVIERELRRRQRPRGAPTAAALKSELAARRRALELSAGLASRRAGGSALAWPKGLPLFAGMMGSRYAGYWLGKLTYQALLEGTLTVPRARELLLSKAPGTGFPERMQELCRQVIQSRRQAHSGSKLDQL